MEVGALEENFGGVLPYFRIGAAHDAGEGDRVVGIRDHEHIRGEFSRLPVQCFKCFTVFRGTDDDAVLV